MFQIKKAENLLNYISKSNENIEKYDNDILYFSTENLNYNYIINSIIKNKILKDNKLSLYDNFIWSFICYSDITLIKRKPTYKNIKQLCNNPHYSNYMSPHLNIKKDFHLSKNIVLSITKQLVYYLHTLHKHYFIHGEPSIKYFSFLNEKSMIFGETHILKLIIDSSPFSSINYENKRFFFCEERVKNFGLPLEKLEVFINGSKNYLDHSDINQEYDKISILFYKIGNKSQNFIKLRNNYGIPFCYKSFDFVCFMISLIKNKYFYKSFSELEEIFNIWKNLWIVEDFENLMLDIEKMRKNNFENILEIIKKYHIRFDALDYFYNNLF